MAVAANDEALRAKCREQFPALAGGWALLENAGGSQVPLCVIDAMSDYMRTKYVQLGAGYPASDAATATVAAGRATCAALMGSDEAAGDAVVVGASASQLLLNLASAFTDILGPEDEIVVSSAAHESNVGPWVRCAARSRCALKWWAPRGPAAAAITCPLEDLALLLSPRTRVVAIPHVSNLLGEVVDVAAVAAAVRAAAPRARVVADGVAFAPHRAMRCAAWGVDFYVYSCYKVMGPHCAALYGRGAAWAELRGPSHYFVHDAAHSTTSSKWELGGAPHESAAGVAALAPYLRTLAGEEADGGAAGLPPPPTLARAFATVEALEAPLAARLLAYLRSAAPDYSIVGPPEGADRVATVSFVHATESSAAIVSACHARQVAVRNGHMYSKRLLEALGIEPEDGVVRASFVHYNTLEEVERLIAALEACRQHVKAAL